MTALPSTEDLARLDDILRDPLSGLTWDNRIMAANAIREVLDRREAGWQLADTAPMTGERIMAWTDGIPAVVHWEIYDPDTATEIGCDGYWSYSENLLADAVDVVDFDYWRPLPTPPSTPTTEASHGE